MGRSNTPANHVFRSSGLRAEWLLLLLPRFLRWDIFRRQVVPTVCIRCRGEKLMRGVWLLLGFISPRLKGPNEQQRRGVYNIVDGARRSGAEPAFDCKQTTAFPARDEHLKAWMEGGRRTR